MRDLLPYLEGISHLCAHCAHIPKGRSRDLLASCSFHPPQSTAGRSAVDGGPWLKAVSTGLHRGKSVERIEDSRRFGARAVIPYLKGQ